MSDALLEIPEAALNILPGTQGAIDSGCTCPVIDNHHGRGYQGRAGVYCYSSDCPIHGVPSNPKTGRGE